MQPIPSGIRAPCVLGLLDPRAADRERTDGRVHSPRGVPFHIRHEAVTQPSRFRGYLRPMEEARSVLERFERIESMRRANAGPVELLAELRALLLEAEEWARIEGGDAGDAAVARLRDALARDMIEA